MEKIEQLKIKDLEIALWLLIPIWTSYHVLSKYGVDYLKANPTFSLVIFYASFPVMFAFLMKFIYDEFPLGAIYKAITTKKEDN